LTTGGSELCGCRQNRNPSILPVPIASTTAFAFKT
jgi:hypothetical protein